MQNKITNQVMILNQVTALTTWNMAVHHQSLDVAAKNAGDAVVNHNE